MPRAIAGGLLLHTGGGRAALRPTGGPEPDCAGFADALIVGRKRQTVRSGRRHDQPVCGITLEGARQPTERNDNFHIEWQDLRLANAKNA